MNEHGGRLILKKNCDAFTRKGGNTCQVITDVCASCMQESDSSSNMSSCHTLSSGRIPSSGIGIEPLELVLDLCELCSRQHDE